MSLALVTPPTAEPVSVAELKAHARIEQDAENELLARYLTAARLHLEGRDGWLNRAFCTQTWDWTLDRFWLRNGVLADDAHLLGVPLAPLQSVTSISYLDAAGALQTLAASQYGVDIASVPGRITPAYGAIWPITRSVPNAVTVRFVAGYGAPAAVPETLRLGLLMLAAHWYEERQPVLVGTIHQKLPFHVEALVLPYRVA